MKSGDCHSQSPLFSYMARRPFLLPLWLILCTGLVTAQRFEIRGPEGGDVRSLAVHPDAPNRFFLGSSDGQIYVSRDSGDSWAKLEPGIGRRDLVIDNLLFHPRLPEVLYAAGWELNNSEGWLYRTRDAGETWELIDVGRFSSRIRAMAISPSDPNVLALGISEGVILSTDEGHSWDRVSRGYRSMHNVESLAFDPLDSSTLYVGTWRLGWKTTDQGKKWTAIHEGMIFDSDMFALLVNPLSPEVLYASACTGVYRSSNGGENWLKLRNGLPKEAKRTRTLQLDPSNPDIIFAGTTVGLFRSRDGGDSWQLLLDNEVINGVAVHPTKPGVILVGTDDAGVLRSRDDGVTFEAANQGFVHRQIQALAAHPQQPDTLFAAVGADRRHGGFFRSSDGGRNWERWNKGLNSEDPARGILEILPDPAGGILLILQNQIQSSTEKGWEPLFQTSKLQLNDAAFLDAAGDKLALATSSGVAILATKTGRLSPRPIAIYDGPIWSVATDLQRGELYVAGDTGVFRSDDEGENWTIKVSGLPPLQVKDLVLTSNILLAVTAKGLYSSEDRGDHWTHKGLDEVDLLTVAASPKDSRWLIATDVTGFLLYESFDGGESWITHEPHRASRIRQLAFSADGRLWAGSLTEGIYLFHPEETPYIVARQ